MKFILLIAIYLLELATTTETKFESSSEELEELQGSHLTREGEEFPIIGEMYPITDEFQFSGIHSPPSPVTEVPAPSRLQRLANDFNYLQSLSAYAMQGILPKVVFTGTRHWDQLLRVYKSPIVFLSLFQLSLGISPVPQRRLQFGVKFSDEEIANFKGLNQPMLIDYIKRLKGYFKVVTGVVLKYCIFTGESEVRFEVQRVFASQDVHCFTPKPWQPSSRKTTQCTLVDTGNKEHLKEALNAARKNKRKSLNKKRSDDNESVISVFSDNEIGFASPSSSDSDD